MRTLYIWACALFPYFECTHYTRDVSWWAASFNCDSLFNLWIPTSSHEVYLREIGRSWSFSLFSNYKYIQCTRFTIQLIANFWIRKCSLSQEIVMYRCCIQMHINWFFKPMNTRLVAGCLGFTDNLHLCPLTAFNCTYTLHSVLRDFENQYQTSKSNIKDETPGYKSCTNITCANINSASEKAFLGVSSDFFCCWTPSKESCCSKQEFTHFLSTVWQHRATKMETDLVIVTFCYVCWRRTLLLINYFGIEMVLCNLYFTRFVAQNLLSWIHSSIHSLLKSLNH